MNEKDGANGESKQGADAARRWDDYYYGYAYNNSPEDAMLVYVTLRTK